MTDQSPNRNLAVHVARSDADRERVYRFRYRVVVDELGGDSVRAHHGLKMLRDPLDSTGTQLFVQLDDEIVAAARLNCGGLSALPDIFVRPLKLDNFAEWGDASLSMTDRLLVSRKGRDTAAAALLLLAAFKMARQHGSRFDFAPCPPSLVKLYEQLGYRRYGENFLDEDETYQVPLVLLLEDYQHLSSINSPFARTAAGMEKPRDTALWFARNFPDAGARPSERVMDEDRFWQFLTDRLHQVPIYALPLLVGLDYKEAKRFLSVGTILRCKEGDCVVRKGDIGREMFVVLSGEVEVRYPDGTRTRSNAVARFGRGAAFGEIAYLADTPRSADVVATSDIEVLVVTQDTMKQAIRQMPEIACRVLFNLSLILCERLRDSTRQWMRGLDAAE